MRVSFTKPFIKDYQNLPTEIQKQVDKQIKLLLKDFRHPSLQAEKMKKKKNVWKARVTRSFRFSFKIEKDTYVLRRVGPHNKILRSP